MDILRFINSKDIANYLKEIEYKFNTLEASWLIYQSRTAALQEKIQAWNEIKATMPDCSVKKRLNCIAIDSWHNFLSEYITLQEKMIQDFQSLNAKCVYKLEIWYEDSNFFDDSGDLFSTYDRCLTAANEALKEDSGIIFQFRIKKIWIDNHNKYIAANYNSDLSLMKIYSTALNDRESDLLNCSFDGLWFDIPTPFKKGDILHDCLENYFGCAAFVVTSINFDPEKDKKIYANLFSYGDNSDMNAIGFFQNEDGSIYHEVMQNYMNCEYYRENLIGKRRILKALSNFIKGSIDESLFARAYHQILMEEYVKDNMPNYYTDEGLELAGLK